MDNQLTATTGGGTQTTTQNPQTVGQPASPGAKSGSVQPGTASALLNNQQGIALENTPLSTVSLSSGSAQPLTSATASQAQFPTKHHVNSALFGFPALLVALAIVIFWLTTRSVKSTTE